MCIRDRLYEFPDFPFEAHTPKYPSGKQVHQYLEQYVRAFDLIPHIALQHNVEACEQTSQGWVIHWENNGRTGKYECGMLVVCSGMYSEPYIPKIDGLNDVFQGQVLHSSEFNESQHADSVTVIGYGKSAIDIVSCVAANGGQAQLVARRLHWPIPREVCNIDAKWAVMSRISVGFMPPWVRAPAWVRLLHRACCCLVKLPWWIAAKIISFKYDANPRCCCCKRDPLVPVDVGVEHELWVGGYTVPAKFYEMIRAGEIDLHQAAVQHVDADGSMELSDGSRTGPTSLIVAATGWGHGDRFKFLPDKVKLQLDIGQDGMYLYRHMLAPRVDNLAFVGSNVSTVSSTLTSAIQAKWLLELVRREFALPSVVEMEKEIAAVKQWKQGTIPFQHDRGGTIMMHQLFYHDEMLQDMGYECQLKSNCFLEMFQPYLPIDYQAILEQGPPVPGAHGPRIGHSDGSGSVICTYVCCFLLALLSLVTAASTFIWCLLDQEDCRLKFF
eukprot:TRINITY_DN20290_c0_g2_i1.p1 TRINITY_DN20290_c0_g2~~TRINITY_DN20290_c0_g2_i1.p1  ORF type:complete len:498 (+),score=87.02 TRINITY_DN20290_c0_g2_i1:153-1646(+)